MKERRQHTRVAVNKHVWIRDFDEDTSPANLNSCLIVDISEGGACIQCSERYQVGQPLAFTYQDFISDGSRPVVGVVMWSSRYSETEYRHGIKFLGLSTQMLRKIQEQVALSGEGANGPAGVQPSLPRSTAAGISG